MQISAAATVRAARTRAGLSQTELGMRSGLPQSVISAYERGRRDPSFTTLRHLVNAAGFDLDVDLVALPESDAPFFGPVGRRLQRHRTTARHLLLDRGYSAPEVFGSVARNTDTADSDIDLLVDLPMGAGLTQIARTAIDLETLIGAPVDLIPRDGLRDRVAREIEHDLVPL